MRNKDFFINHLAQTSDLPLALEVERAEGMYIYDTKGNKYLDLISGIGVANIGHSNHNVIKAIENQAKKHLHVMVYGEYVQNPQVAYGKRLLEYLPENLQNIYFTNSGAEATEGAMKLAKRYTGKYEFISCENAYHGSTQGALSLAGGTWFQDSYRPLLPMTNKIRFNHFEDIEKITSKTAAVFIEPVQAEAGVILPVPNYLNEIRKRCNETGTLLIFDECQTGLGRTGHLFGFEYAGVIPDVLLLGKALGGGLPLGAFITSKSIMETLTYNPVLGHITTFGGNPLSCASGLAAFEELLKLDIIHSLPMKVEQVKNWIKSEIGDFEIRNAGMLMSVELGSFENVISMIKSLYERHILSDWFLFNNTSIRVAPPLIWDL